MPTDPADRLAEPGAAPETIDRFVVGMPRSGTEGLTRRLNTRPDVAAFGETLYWGRHWVEPDADGRYGPGELERVIAGIVSEGLVTTIGGSFGALASVDRDGLRRLLEDALRPADGDPRPTPGETFRRVGAAIAAAEGTRVWIEKTTHHVNWIDRILEHLPNARFVVMLREPYGFMLSYKHQGDRRPEAERRAIERLYHPLWASLVWRGAVRAAEDAAARHPQRVMVVWLHELDERLATIQRFLGLDPVELPSPPSSANTSFPGGRRPELRPEDLFWMNLVNRGRMRDRGLETRSVPAAPRRITGSILRLPWWAGRSYLTMRRMTRGSVLGYLARWIRRT